jgi:hypothetical protein
MLRPGTGDSKPSTTLVRGEASLLNEGSCFLER